jgi:hypothetical protein
MHTWHRFMYAICIHIRHMSFPDKNEKTYVAYMYAYGKYITQPYMAALVAANCRSAKIYRVVPERIKCPNTYNRAYNTYNRGYNTYNRAYNTYKYGVFIWGSIRISQPYKYMACIYIVYMHTALCMVYLTQGKNNAPQELYSIVNFRLV